MYTHFSPVIDKFINTLVKITFIDNTFYIGFLIYNDTCRPFPYLLLTDDSNIVFYKSHVKYIESVF